MTNDPGLAHFWVTTEPISDMMCTSTMYVPIEYVVYVGISTSFFFDVYTGIHTVCR